MNTKKTVESYEGELLNRLGKLVAVNSAEGQPEADAPFGKGPRDVLLTALDMMEKDGFKTVNLDNYIGYAEMGEGDDIIGIIGHLDVVPAKKSDGWDTDPFTMTEKDGVLYGRGVADDKGAVVASMIAMKTLRDMGVPMHKRVRLIMGTNEETGSKGLAYYVQKEGSVNLGFTPDASFPLVHGEKGLLGLRFKSKKTGIRQIQGGSAKNIVCNLCSCVVDRASFSKKALEDYFRNNNLPYEMEDGEDGVKITVHGVASHGSLPELGKNAISHLLVGLKSAGYQDPFVDFYCKKIGLDTDGSGLGIACHDEYGALSMCNGMIWMENGQVIGTLDIRFPVSYTGKSVLKLLQGNKEDDGGVVEVLSAVEPLFYPLDSPLVKALMEAYQETTGDLESQPMTIGGGTYAKGMDNTVAFGCSFPETSYHIHEPNECCPVAELLKQAEIYVNAILKLLAV